MNVDKNSYTFSFAIVMVIVVAGLLSFTAINLKKPQLKNIELEKKQNILSSIGINVERDQAGLNFDKYIKEKIVLNSSGEEVKGDAFKIDLSKELKKNKKDQLLPLYVANVEGEKKYIIPLRGKGLWGPIWGFLSLENDFNTVYGAVFDHKSETPGLGAEINQYEDFQQQFEGKQILEGAKVVSITVWKGGAKPDDVHGVDGISGGTITSDGVTYMLEERLNMYAPYFKNMLEQNKQITASIK
tara:strand:- start:928 stop:1656 length:729 start_codon:yes stop_codon:yes gene_type:complete